MIRKSQKFAMDKMDKPKIKKRTFLMKVFWVGIIGIALTFLSVRVVISDKTSRFYVGIDNLFMKNKK